ncbi:tRNA (N(6)-L-threonylcarbamoyladenosine(37)-C(2))-methylthiotransferase MtaB [Pseudoflavonifractor sp. An184]|uniref:tRNA (N(6)-L-threonylcarbamoyladenosine(37)-C(2))- methylthiotransferase MtaB n=1 Tax=Pseudoflavonifractor sp. An184 TaxID=1965576 RepID=UPI000B385968|nr:tRNA (N(6)-L-threonylcarbamoyladenosine(37)-C(2))-methylthiotransferase MtaB [Pseudoflavonifractor sp. An184]MBS5549956.1 tRNA (N(6)-L-threonylcarbamoyladenosine(37)-C(2))-methylthiotransferase MtaB [Oscillospiraceae bacterium]OUP50061.1 tRNA (N(6)-L-threonylcarbamoyladenosine(37)-C(2))-methylthiotransferase MtaB [Pseudoflavonifractor sp. An184]
MKIAFYTLGCKVNQYETQALEQLVTQRGHSLVPFEETADAYVINTCTVTAVSDKKSRQVIRRARKAAPDAVIAVCGCYPQTHPDDVEKLGVDLISGTGDRTGFVDLLEREWRDRQPITALDDAFQRRSFESLPAGGLEGRTRAMLKMEDGCVNFCSYCIIPYARGRVRSLPLADCVRQARELEAAGYREIVLTGIEISSWGQDLEGKPELMEAIEAICQGLSPDTRVRLGSLEPRTITPDFCRRAAALPNLCPHFHLSMQSGCDTVLARMNRKYDSNRYYKSVTFLHEAYDRPAVTTDLIVGFPGETEEEFQQTLDFIQKCAFSAMHIFPYSKRPGTPAAKLPGQVRNAVKEERAHRAAQIARTMQDTYLDSWVGETVPVLFEEEREGLWRGHTTRYCEVEVQSVQPLHNQLRQVQITGHAGGALQGVLV